MQLSELILSLFWKGAYFKRNDFAPTFLHGVQESKEEVSEVSLAKKKTA